MHASFKYRFLTTENCGPSSVLPDYVIALGGLLDERYLPNVKAYLSFHSCVCSYGF